MSERVLDASALLALILKESGGEIVGGLLDGSMISAVNLSEVFSKLDELGLASDELIAGVEGLGIEVVEFDFEHAINAARLRTKTRTLGLSLGDRACIALGVARGLPVVTADRAWQQLAICEVVLIR